MIIKNNIYGKFEIDSPVIIELINSKPLQRLKKISQYGVPDEFYHLKNYSRFQHSIDVFLLLKKLEASEEEQIAGLLHDMSHTAFSHVVDWVLGDGKTEEFQNEKHREFLKKSEVSTILKKYGYNPNRIANHSIYSLLEQEIPKLCADRIGYSLREFPKKTAIYCIENILNRNGKILFKNEKSAFIFGINFLKMQTNHWGGLEATSRYRLFANVLKLALNKKIISFSDFWEDEKMILKKIDKAKNSSIDKILYVLRKKSLSNLAKSREVVYKKFRYVDPVFLENGKLFKLSKVNKKFNAILKNARKINKKGVNLPFID